MVTTGELSRRFGLQHDLLRKIILQNEMPHTQEADGFGIADDSADFLLELYYQKKDSMPREPERGFTKMLNASRLSVASGEDLPYVVLQVTLKEKLIGTGSKNLDDLEYIINKQVEKGYRLHTMSTSNGGSKGLAGGDRIQATLVFERLDLR